METKLNQFDQARIDRGLERAFNILETNGPMSAVKLAQQDDTAVLALFEALCSMPYVAEPETRQRFFNKVFQDVQSRKPLRLGPQVLPTMTFFLFAEDAYRNKFARNAWEAQSPESLTATQFEWAVHDFLKNAIRDVSAVNPSTNALLASHTQVKLFWEGFLLMLNAMSEEIVLHCLRGMDADVYHLVIQHLQLCDSEELLSLMLQAISALMSKSSKAFWGALQDLPRQQLAQFVFKNAAFPRFLARSLEYDRLVDDGNVRVPFFAVWVKALLRSLQDHELPDTCQSLTDNLLTPDSTLDSSREVQTTRTIAGLYALRTALDVFNGTFFKIRLSTSLAYINLVINLVAKYATAVINPAAELRPEDRYNVGLSHTALDVIKLSLLLDAKTTRTEWTTLMRGTSKIPRTVPRHSAQLWEGFLIIFWPGRPGSVGLARSMLLAMYPLSGITRFVPPKREQLKDPDKKLFNVDLDKTSEAVGRMVERLTSFTTADLEPLCCDKQSGMMYAIVASLVHSEDPIREAGIAFIKHITGESSRSDAVAQMVQDYFHPFLTAFSDVVRSITYDKDSMNPYAPMPHVLTCSRDLVTALCDTSGLLRSKTLSGIEHAAVTSWWTTQWESMQHSFLHLRYWSNEMEKHILEKFCRDTMDLAQSLLAQDGVVASALRAQNSEKDAMKEVLEQVRSNTKGMADMIKLRDVYLLDVTVKTLVKLLNRLAEYDLEVDEKTALLIKNACIPRSEDKKFAVNTNLTPAQRAELLKALREDEDLPQIIKVVEKQMKQSSLEAWSKSGGSTPLSRSGASTPSTTSRTSKPTTTGKLKELLSAGDKPKPKPLKPETRRLDANRIVEERKRAKAEKAARDAAAIAKAKALRTIPGEGSGLSGLAGILGKDHAPQQKSDMMVDSSEEDDESSDDETVLTGKSKLDPEARKRALELAAKKMGPLRKEKLKRSAKDMRARLIPPMESLHQAILDWDIFHDGNDPPNGAECVEVANTYMTHRNYKDTFFPLLLFEAWRSFVTAKDETTSKPFGIRVVNRMTVDRFLEVTTLMPATQNKDRFLSEGDIVIISKSDDPLNKQDQPHCLARIWKTTFKRENLEVAYRLSSRNNQLMSLLNPGADFQAIKITNMTTIEREYAALESLQYYDLLDEVLEAKASPLLNYGEEAISQVMTNYLLNPGQAKAIMNAKDNDGFILIQGPPGTGKTKTIVAMVGSLLTGHIGNRAATAVPVVRPGIQGNQPPPMKKLLVCAPSNAAVDELVLRLKQGVKTMSGTHHKIEVLRLGRSDAINAQVKDVTLDERVKAAMEAEANKNGPGTDRDKLHQEAGEIKAQLNDLRPRLESARASDDRAMISELQRQFDVLKRRQGQIGAKIDADKDSGNSFARENEIKRRNVQQKILDSAQVLCATLSGSGHEMFKNLNVEFETVIIDEAAQCVELSALIPLKYGATKCILVGDPKQLPPTVLSQSAARFGYDQSLFVRMQRNHPQNVHLLDTQYRMHPEISAFPSAEFYERKLYDGDDMGRLRLQPWHESKVFSPYQFFDVEGVQEKGRKGQSLVNTRELEVAMQLYHRFSQDYPSVDLKGKVGIITPYKAQLQALRERFANRWGEAIFEQIEFNTTDAFQGRECEIIIFSCVRASPTGGIGFMTDIRRMNVGLTRAKSSLWILGDSRALRQGEFWNKLIEDARARKRYTNGDILSLLRRPSEKIAGSNAYNGWGNIKSVDVEMKDAPPDNGFKHEASYGYSGPSQQKVGGLNEKGEVVKTARSSMPPQIGDSKKRMLDNADALMSASKRPVSLWLRRATGKQGIYLLLLMRDFGTTTGKPFGFRSTPGRRSACSDWSADRSIRILWSTGKGRITKGSR